MLDTGAYNPQTNTASCGQCDRSVGVSAAGVWLLLCRRPSNKTNGDKTTDCGQTTPDKLTFEFLPFFVFLCRPRGTPTKPFPRSCAAHSKMLSAVVVLLRGCCLRVSSMPSNKSTIQQQVSISTYVNVWDIRPKIVRVSVIHQALSQSVWVECIKPSSLLALSLTSILRRYASYFLGITRGGDRRSFRPLARPPCM